MKLFSHPKGLAFHQAYTPSNALKKYGIGLPKKETLRSSTERFWVKKFPGIKQ
jgi:hypothetical protein